MVLIVILSVVLTERDLQWNHFWYQLVEITIHCMGKAWVSCP